VTTTGSSPTHPEPTTESGAMGVKAYTPDPEDVAADQPAATLDAAEEIEKEMADSLPATDPPA
jgi:hypothetical protein